MRFLGIALGLVVVALPASGQETKRYTYDAQGRLRSSDQRRVGGAGAFTVYEVDKAFNRSRVQVTVPYSAVSLAPGSRVPPDHHVISPDGRFRFAFQFDGNVVLYDQSGTPIWNLGTWGSGADSLAMQEDGNLVLYRQGQPIWHTHSHMYPGSSLHVQSDGNVVLYDSSMIPRWTTNTCCR